MRELNADDLKQLLELEELTTCETVEEYEAAKVLLVHVVLTFQGV